MKRIISYIFMCCLLWVGCTSTTEGLAPDKVITVSNNKIEMESKGGKTSIKVDSYCDWLVTSDEEWQWISVSNKSGKKGITTLDITVNENIATSKRSAVLTLANDMYGVSQQINITQGNRDAFINISDSRYEVSSTGTIKSIDVESNTTWTTSCDADWITLSPTNGDGSSTLQITIKPNTTTEIRETTVKVANKEHNITKEIAIKQAAFSPELTVDVSSLDFSCNKQEKSLTLDANISWTASCDADWIALSPQSGNEGNTTIKITVEKNTKSTQRNTTLKFYNSSYNINKEVRITQEAFAPELTVDESSLEFTCDKQEKSLTVDANIDWATSCNADWVTISPQSGKEGKSTIKITVEKNTKSTQRNTTLKFYNSSYNINKEVTITQKELSAYITTDNTNIGFSRIGGTADIKISSSVSWEANCDADWVILSQNSGNSGTSTLKVVTTDNKSTDYRNAIITVSNRQEGISKEITVYQDPIYLYATETITLPIDGSMTTTIIDSNIPWEANCNADWVEISPHSSSELEGYEGYVRQTQLNISASPNTNSYERTAIITISNSIFDVSLTIDITQKGIGNNMILYTSTDNEKIEIYPFDREYGANYISNTYNNGIGTILFDGPITSISKSAFSYGENLKSIIIPYTVTTIGENAFSHCSGLTNITLPENLTHIGESAFSCCSFTNIILPENLTHIGGGAFGCCSSLTTITIPEKVTNIGENVFVNCYELKTIYCKPTIPPVLEGRIDTAYTLDQLEAIYVPSESVNAYKNAEVWKLYNIIGYDF